MVILLICRSTVPRSREDVRSAQRILYSLLSCICDSSPRKSTSIVKSRSRCGRKSRTFSDMIHATEIFQEFIEFFFSREFAIDNEIKLPSSPIKSSGQSLQLKNIQA